MASSSEILSVFDLTRRLQNLIGADPILQDVWIEGEVSNYKLATSGHAYFTLKDERSSLRAVAWRTTLARLSYRPTDGDRVRVHGQIEIYAPRGEYQLIADAIRSAGLGDLYQQFERLKQKLEAEGLFDATRKRPLPAFPRLIGVVTSPGAAAFQDIQNVLRRRYPLARILLAPALVQGEEAPTQIERAIRRISEHGRVDVLLVIRGGGSIEDLWAFNDERVARAVYECKVPVVTGVGHETDFTIVDFVADRRAPTPSAAAELVTPDVADLKGWLRDRSQALADTISAQLEDSRDRVNVLERALRHLSPRLTLGTLRQRLDELDSRQIAAALRRIALNRERLVARQRALTAANPTNILARGYAIVTRERDGQRISGVSDANPGESVQIHLKNGQLKATVKEQHLDR